MYHCSWNLEQAILAILMVSARRACLLAQGWLGFERGCSLRNNSENQDENMCSQTFYHEFIIDIRSNSFARKNHINGEESAKLTRNSSEACASTYASLPITVCRCTKRQSVDPELFSSLEFQALPFSGLVMMAFPFNTVTNQGRR